MNYEGYWPVDVYFNHENRLSIKLENAQGKKAIFAYSRFLVENMMDEPLPHGMEVHHKDFNKLNNEPENLVVISKLEHRKYHNCVNIIRGLVTKKPKPIRQKPENFKGFVFCKEFKKDKEIHVLLQGPDGKFFSIEKEKYLLDKFAEMY